MKALLIGLAVLPLATGTGRAAIQLDDTQLDMVTAGQLLGVECPGCTLSSSTSTSNNGTTITVTTITIVPPESDGTGGTGNGGTGGTGGNNGGNGGNNGGNGGGTGGTGGNTGPTGPSVVTSIPVPANLAGLLTTANTSTITPH
jgi:hypothetical protein